MWGCAGPDLKPRPDMPEPISAPIPKDSRLGRATEAVTSRHPDQSGFYLLDKGEEALLWRGALADMAERTLDLQYYIWHNDNVGKIAAERILRAAERGVRVRVLVDDIALRVKPRHLRLLNAHPEIEIRLYNPLGRRSGESAKFSNIFMDFGKLNRRMHNKVFIADGCLAIVGGRNIGDEYFDMHAGFNFRDIDVLGAGAVVEEISLSFETYWNSQWVHPVEDILADDIETVDMEKGYDGLHRYARNPDNFPPRFNRRLGEVKTGL